MTNFTLYTQETAPEGSKGVLQSVSKAYGVVPNLLATLAESPATVEAYATLSGIFDKSDFTPTERQIILMTNNRLNGCTYCMAAHSTVSKMQGLPADVISALRDGTALADTKLEALRVFTAKVVEQRGYMSDADVQDFLAAGYSKGNILEVILGTSLKIISNYTNHVANTPVDAAFAAAKWSVEESAA
jgi:uncharacterized peroxidase-related enzyme